MALQGTLETFSVPEVLRLLSGTKKTGLLALDGDRGSGRVWLAEGQIAGARSDHEPDGLPEAVLFDLLRYEDGSFVFETGTEYDGDDPGAADVETALESAERLLEEWREIESVVPSLRVWVSMVPTISDPSITVTAEQWSALAIVGRGTSGHRLGDELGLGELDASRRIRDLVEAGLVEVDDTPLERDLEPVSFEEPASEEPAAESSDQDALHGDQELDEPASDAAPAWTPGPDLAQGLAGFVARASAEEREERTSAWGEVDEELVHVETAHMDAVHVDPAHDDTIDVTDHGPAEDALDDEPDGFDAFDDDFDEIFDGDSSETDAFDDDAIEEDEVAEEVAELAAEPGAEGPDSHAAGEDESQDGFLSQLANLSPKAAAAIEATASAEETASSVPKLPSGDGDEEINRNLLLKFLSSAKP